MPEKASEWVKSITINTARIGTTFGVHLVRGFDNSNIYIGPSDYVPWLKDNKICFLRIEAEQFGGIPMNLELRLSVEDSPNSASVVMDAVRAAKVALDRGLCGPIIEASAYLFKSPVKQFEDTEAREMLKQFAEPKI